MKTIFENVSGMVPVILVNNRELNLTFYKEALGLKVISEENALAILGGKTAKTIDDAVLIIEESPSMRTRAVNGVKKLRKIVLESPEFTEGFEKTSPEGDVFEVVPSASTSDELKIRDIELSTANLAESLAFYTEGFGLKQQDNRIFLPFGTISYTQAQGPDLMSKPEEVWDLEIIEFKVAKTVDLKQIAAQLDDLSLAYYVDPKAKVLTLSDAQNTEIWFAK